MSLVEMGLPITVRSKCVVGGHVVIWAGVWNGPDHPPDRCPCDCGLMKWDANRGELVPAYSPLPESGNPA